MNNHSGGLLPKRLSPFTWGRRTDEKIGEIFELIHCLPNQNNIVLAQVSERRDEEGLRTGNYQSQFTCKVEDFKLAPVITLQGCIIQISWYFGMTPAEVYRQFRDTRIFEPQPCSGYRDYVWRKKDDGIKETYTLYKRIKPTHKGVNEEYIEEIEREHGWATFGVKSMRSKSVSKLIALINRHHGLYVNVDYGNVETHVLRDVETYEKFYTEHPEEVRTQGDPK